MINIAPLSSNLPNNSTIWICYKFTHTRKISSKTIRLENIKFIYPLKFSSKLKWIVKSCFAQLIIWSFIKHWSKFQYLKVKFQPRFQYLTASLLQFSIHPINFWISKLLIILIIPTEQTFGSSFGPNKPKQLIIIILTKIINSLKTSLNSRHLPRRKLDFSNPKPRK